MKTLITSEDAPPAVGPYSPGLAVGEWIFLSGQGGFDPNTGRMISDDIAEQTEQTFRNMEVLLEAAGASLYDVVSCLVHVTGPSQQRGGGSAPGGRPARRRPPPPGRGGT